MLETLLRDLRHALRIFVQSPAFALAAVAALSLGIGVNTAIFSVVNAVLLRPLAFPEADRLVYFMSTSPQGSGTYASPAKFVNYRQQDQVTEAVSAFNTGVVNFTGGTFPEQLRSARVSREFFRLFGATTVLGRTFTPDEDLPGGPRVAVLAQALWTTRFDRDPNVVGKAISLGGEPHTIVGVLGTFHFEDLGEPPQVFVPFQLDPNTRDQGHYFQVAGRLKPGVTLQQARARVQASRGAFESQFPGALGDPKKNKTRAVLVVSEVALALTLLIGSALLIRTAMALGRVDPGFDARNVLTMRMSLKAARFQTSEAVDQAIRTGVERLRTLPGVVTASATCCVPLEGGYGLPFTIVGRPAGDGPFHGGGQWMTASPGYFDVFKIPVKRGRAFDERDDGRAPGVVVINEAMAKKFWTGADPLADRLVIGRGVMREFADEPERQIIGVVGDTRDGGLNQDPGPAMYIPQAQVPDAANALNVGLSPMGFVVRTAGEPMAMSASIQEELRRATGLPVSDVRPMSEVVSRSTSRERFNMWLMTVFGAAALLLAAIGIYGLMAYSVEQRTQELGIRVALGAQARDVRRMVVAQGVRLVGIGLAIGLAASFGLARLIESFLFGVRTRDPLVFVGVPDPIALRYE